ncbi:MAG: hypothetical protein HOM55_06990 [Proteobacteria bacterium]|jgi:hypothetical protein|nr:hypothetical protein [Pseudomonadota bacterium]
MSTEALQLVRPTGSRYETFALLLITALLISAQMWYVSTLGRQTSEEEIYAWQVSSFSSFEGADQAIYNSLFTVKDEIPYIYDDVNMFNEPGEKFHWPNLQDFQDYLLPPFYHDISWEQNGSVGWLLYEPVAEGEMQGYSMYLGTNGMLENQGSFLLTIGHVHAGFSNNNSLDIWWHPQRSIDMPESGFKDTLVRQGWQLVVPYSGDKEVKRIFGE